MKEVLTGNTVSLMSTSGLELSVARGTPATAKGPGVAVRVTSRATAAVHEAEPRVERYAGATRYGTAAEVATQSYPNGAETVVLVNGESVSADSLIAGSYGAQHGAPVLLTDKDHIPEETLATIRNLGAKHVVLIGGSGVIDRNVVTAAQSMGLSVKRIGGENRYETAERVARQLEPSRVAFIASGTTLVDALPGAAAASLMNAPILYVGGDEVRSETMQTLAQLGVRDVVVLGGPHAISEEVYEQLDNKFNTRRLAGRDRYETALAIADYMRTESAASISEVFLARSDNPIDAVAAAASRRPVLFTMPSHLNVKTARFVARHSLGVTLLGSTGALHQRVERDARAAFRTTFVSTRNELLDALAQAERGDVVYVDGDATIDLTGDEAIVVPAGVTLRSDRGLGGSSGALLKKQSGTSTPLLILEEGAVISRLRLQGPDTSTQCRDCAPRYTGIDIRGNNARVENSEVWGWSMAIRVREARNAGIRHNHIHHNRRSELGYGVVLYGSADALVEHNHFHDNRHSIAGSGERDQSYEARYNLIDGGATGSVFDMHGEWENPQPGNEDSIYAGSTIHIHHNTVIVPSSIPVVAIRGVPHDIALVENNCFSHPSVNGVAWQQRPPYSAYAFLTTPPYVANMTLRNNRFGHTNGTCY